MTFAFNAWESRRRPMLMAVLLLLLLTLESESIKVSIRSDIGDWCIRAKNGRSVTIEKCYWGLAGNVTNILKAEQTFDVHPATDDEDEEENTGSGSQQPVPFLIRLSRKQQSLPKGSSPNAATSCLSSISSTLSVEKCHLRKSQFRLSPTFPAKLQQANFCSSLEMEQAYESSPDIRYSLHSSGQSSCLEHMVKSSNSHNGSQKTFTHSLAFSKCTEGKAPLDEGKVMMPKPQLWQFCTKDKNCSLSLLDMKWSSRIMTVFPTTEPSQANCKKEEDAPTTIGTTTTSTTATTTTTTMDEFPENVEAHNRSTTLPPTHNGTMESINSGWPNETFMLTEIPAGSGSSLRSSVSNPVMTISILSGITYISTHLIKIIVHIYLCGLN